MAALDERIVALEARLATLKQQREAKARIARQEARTAERKMETRRKIEFGGLAKIAGLLDIDNGAQLGGLLFLRPLFEDPERFAEMKRIGDAMLAERERSRKGKAAANGGTEQLPAIDDEYLR